MKRNSKKRTKKKKTREDGNAGKRSQKFVPSVNGGGTNRKKKMAGVEMIGQRTSTGAEDYFGERAFREISGKKSTEPRGGTNFQSDGERPGLGFKVYMEWKGSRKKKKGGNQQLSLIT